MFKSLICFALASLVAASSLTDVATQITNNVLIGMKTAAKSVPKMTVKDKNSALSAMKAVKEDFPKVCMKAIVEVSATVDATAKNAKMSKMTAAFKAIKLIELGFLNVTFSSMHPEIMKKAMKKSYGNSKNDFTGMVNTLEKRAKDDKSPISKAEMEVLKGGIDVLESDETLELVAESIFTK